MFQLSTSSRALFALSCCALLAHTASAVTLEDGDYATIQGAEIGKVDPASGDFTAIAPVPATFTTTDLALTQDEKILVSHVGYSFQVTLVDPATGGTTQYVVYDPGCNPFGSEVDVWLDAVAVEPSGGVLVGGRTTHQTNCDLTAAFAELHRLDLNTGSISTLSAAGLLDAGGDNVQDLAVAPNGDIYWLNLDGTIIRINPGNGAQALVASIPTVPYAITSDDMGNLVALSRESQGSEMLMSHVDTSSGVVTPIGLVDDFPSASGPGMEFDENGALVISTTGKGMIRTVPTNDAVDFEIVAPNTSWYSRLAIVGPSHVSAPACADGIDNDGDGAADFPADPGCASPFHDDEAPECDDGFDNDGDGDADFGADLGCASPSNEDESPFCSDGIDNDSDGLTDAADPGCDGPADTTETTACNDGIDNDNDGKIDFPADKGCDDVNDMTERQACGLGFEGALIMLPLITGLRSLRRRKSA